MALGLGPQRTGVPQFHLSELRNARTGVAHPCRYRLALMGLARPANPLGIAQRGAPERRLGHASVSFTLDKYSHFMPDDDQQAAVAVANLVDAATRSCHR